jgi:hypothetical protein
MSSEMEVQKANNLVITELCFNLRLMQEYKLKTVVFWVDILGKDMQRHQVPL